MPFGEDRMNDERIQVECYSGYRANERPKAFTFRGRRLEILDVVDRWYEGGVDPQRPQIDYFKVKAGDGKIYLLRYQSLFDAWSIHVCDTPAKMSP